MMRDYSMKSKRRKNHQRWLNAFIKYANKCIEDDDLWLGRFVVKQNATQMHWFEDGSGGILYCDLTFRDKKTGRTKRWYTDCLELDWHYWIAMNNFIIEDCQVWSEVPDIRDNRIDFRGIK